MTSLFIWKMRSRRIVWVTNLINADKDENVENCDESVEASDKSITHIML